MGDRSERREEIKLMLEYGRVGISLIGLGALVFAGLQWMGSNRVALLSNRVAILNGYERMAVEWRDHLRLFVEQPDLRPYFEEGAQLAPDDSKRNLVLAIADLRLDVMDAVLTYPALLDVADDIEGWRNTFRNAFRTSPVLCARLRETESNYGFIVPIAAQACGH
jgi:hypothetical protein